MPDRIAQALVDWLRQRQVHHHLRDALRRRLRDPDGSRRARGLRRRRSTCGAWRFCVAHRPRARVRAVVGRHPRCPTPSAASSSCCSARRTQRALLVWAHVLYWFLLVLFAGFYVATLFGVSKLPAAAGRRRTRCRRPFRRYSQRQRPRCLRRARQRVGRRRTRSSSSSRACSASSSSASTSGGRATCGGRPSISTGGAAASGSGSPSASSAIGRHGRVDWMFHPNPMRPTAVTR